MHAMFKNYRERKARGLASIEARDGKPILKVKLWSRTTGEPEPDMELELSRRLIEKRKADIADELTRIDEVLVEFQTLEIFQ